MNEIDLIIRNSK